MKSKIVRAIGGCSSEFQTMSASALDSMSATGNKIVARVTPNDGGRLTSSCWVLAVAVSTPPATAGALTGTSRVIRTESKGPQMTTVVIGRRMLWVWFVPSFAWTVAVAISGLG